MSFLIKRRDGFTNKLLRKVHSSEEGRFDATALAEGPFGMHFDSIHFGTYAYTVEHRGDSLACILWHGTAHSRRDRDNSPNLLSA
jgi:hypothetical protein